MRARNIKPAFFKNYDLADCGAYAQILFAGLWCMADKDGRLENKPRLIKAEVFPYYDVDINGELTKLERLGFIRRYSTSGYDVVEVMNFKKHQNPHHTEKASKLPSCENQSDVSLCNKTEKDINESTTVNSRLNNGEYLADSLIPDSLIPDSLIPEPKEKQSAKAPAKKTPKPAFVLPDWFTDSDVKNWEAWNSIAKRRNATHAQLAISLEKLSKWRDKGVDWSKALENSAVGGWQGLFEPAQVGASNGSQRGVFNKAQAIQDANNAVVAQMFGDDDAG